MSIEAEDKARRQVQNTGRKTEEMGISDDNRIKNGIEEDTQKDIINKIISELESENMEGNDIHKRSDDLKIGKAIEFLGIQRNQDSLSSPIFGKIKGKRGRRSLKDLREAEGLSREQQKIDQLFKVGKGKCLPKEK